MHLNKRLSLIAICLGVAISAMAFSSLNIALASIQEQFKASITQLQWVTNICGITICSTLVLFGRLADIYGRKKTYLLGIILLFISMLGSGLAKTPNMLIFFQLILGLGGAILIPVSQALITNLFEDRRQSHALGIRAATIGLALALVPLLSGIVIDMLGWRWVFFINIPFVFISFILIIMLLPESEAENMSDQSIDISGTILLAICISSFVTAITQTHAWPASTIVSLYVVSAITLVLLLFVEKKAKFPIIKEELFTNKTFLLASLGNFCMMFFIWSCLFMIPLYLQTVHQYSALDAGFIMLFVTMTLAILSFVIGRFYDAFGPRKIILAGFVFFLCSALGQMILQSDTSLTIIALCTICFGIGWGLIWSPSTTLAISSLPRAEAGVASGSLVTIQEAGGTLGLAITATTVKMQDTLLSGYHNAMWILVAISLLGFVASFFKESKFQHHLSI